MEAETDKDNEGLWSLLAGLRFSLATWVLFDHTYNFGPPERAMPIFTKSGLVAFMCFFVISGPRGINSKRIREFLNYLGDISFPLYVLHYPLLFLATSSVLKTHPNWNNGITQVCIALVGSIIALMLVDKPLRRLARTKYAEPGADTRVFVS